MAPEKEKNIYNLLQLRYGIIGRSQPMQQAIEMLLQAAPTDLSVLITGETGTGKEVFANALHGQSHRNKQPFLSVNCGAIPETLLESELFGHEKGAFTGAYDLRKGYFEVADKGTILLDEIGEMPVGTQVKLLRVLESGEFSRLGSTSTKKVNVRVIAATNKNLEEEVQKGNFRKDLYYRLKSVHIDLPPLRKHTEDIPELVEYFAQDIAGKMKFHFDGIASDALGILKTLPWQGNIRELKNLVETIVTMEKGAYITPELLRRYIPPQLPPYEAKEQSPESSLVRRAEREDSGQFELGLIFRTLLELKNEVSDMHSAIDNIYDELHSLREAQESFNTMPIEEVITPESYVNDSDLKLHDMEKKVIEMSLQKYKGNRRQAAKALGISERTLYRKISEYNLTEY